ncbi:Rossmann-like and DUF2520 domain-containing protein [Proteiniphilum acetatigenes]|uniref:Rossmann-like and DUF2520 domain-containing protein n=1 Tax=Proteiniphilum acetatigenes TaxID=294710 RepID=UPI000382C2C3|nr:Rossmann-like and DUF2520 domain-containing protein [Proteiniphilum acetatigenes]SFL10532.1 Predicted oxidoreductase, contains short-chain dehydrogenase (SDR) and DUF2520 domains [Porphyromonadaceae bacterium KH3CP3RA]
MKVVFIGSGNVATHMAMALKGVGNGIVQVYSRTSENAELLADRVGAEPIDNLEDIYCTADFYIFSVKDDILPEIVAQMPSTTGIWAHTAGSIPVSVLSPHKKRGALYPLQTFSREREVNFQDIPLFIEGESDETAILLKELAETISGNVHFLSGDKRRILHLAAVFACNFTNHMYTLASEIMSEEEIPFHLLNPLINETAAKVTVMEPKAAQTGPAVRFDEKVMQKHLELLKDPLKREIYSLLSSSIHKVSGNRGANETQNV